jgi:hypothetical protein
MSIQDDTYIRQALKDWADQNEPPQRGKARLLLLASTSGTKVAHMPMVRAYDRERFLQFSNSTAADLAAEAFQSPWLLLFRIA